MKEIIRLAADRGAAVRVGVNAGSISRPLLRKHGGRDETYVETQHDLGASLGGLISAGEINYLEVGDGFARAGRTGKRWLDSNAR